MIKLKVIGILLFVGALTACGQMENGGVTAVTDHEGEGEGSGPNLSMRDRHHAPIPEEYASLVSPVASDGESQERGAAIYEKHCLVCHGEEGMGDGPAGAALAPAPVAVAHTSQRMSDAYLFYRISEGGSFAPFNSVMPAWKDVLDEQSRWDVINYMRALGSGKIDEHGGDYDPVEEAAKHAEIVATGVEQGVITPAEGDLFLAVHAELDVLLASGSGGEMRGGTDSRQVILLRQLVADGVITQADGDLFTAVHEKLITAGLME